MIPNTEDWARYSEATAAKNVLDLLDTHFDGVQAKLDRDLFHKLDSGVVLSPEEALQFIHMKHANYQLMKTLSNKLKAGQSAAGRLAPMFNQGAQDA